MRRVASAPVSRGRSGPPAGPPAVDPALVRRMERSLALLDPVTLFRRRLRGVVVSGFVAEREGIGERPRAAREMGRLGRAVLYASLTMALSVTAAGAASQDALPGDALYGVKLKLEEIRMQVAPPSVRAELAALALDQRLDELERLADAGTWGLVAPAAARVADAQELVSAVEQGLSAAERRAAAQAQEVLADVLAAAPARARERLERIIDSATPGASGSQGSSASAPRGGQPQRPMPHPSQMRSPSDPRDGARVDRAATAPQPDVD